MTSGRSRPSWPGSCFPLLLASLALSNALAAAAEDELGRDENCALIDDGWNAGVLFVPRLSAKEQGGEHDLIASLRGADCLKTLAKLAEAGRRALGRELSGPQGAWTSGCLGEDF